HVGATTDHEVDTTFSQLTTTVTQSPFSLTVPANGGLGLTDGETFTVSDGTITETFEFDNDGILTTVPGPGVCSYCSIPYLDQDSSDQIAGLVAGALASAPLGLNPLSIGGGVVQLGAGANHSVDVTQGSLTRQMSIGGINDAERFTITNGVDTVTFEFDNDGIFIDSDMDNVPDNTLLPFTTASTHLDLADQMVAAITSAGLGLDPIHIGGGIVNIGGTPLHILTSTFAPSLIVTGDPGVRATTTLHLPTAPALQVPPNGGADIADAEMFVLGNGNQIRSFEFDSDGVFVDADGDLAPDNILITFTGTETRTAMAVAVSTAISLSGLGFMPMPVANGVIDLGAPPTGMIGPLTNTSLTRADRVGTSLLDGDVFSIDDGSNTVFFEFEDASLGNGVIPGNESILYTPGSDVDTVADTMVAVIASAGLNLAPVNLGDGAVELNDSPGHLVDVTASSLTQSGVPGGGVLVKIRSDFSDAQVAASIVKSINTANTTLPFENVTAQIRGGSTLFVDIDQFKVDNQGNVTVEPADYVDGSAAVTGISNFFLSAVKDLPGNSLEANQSTDETQFTILLPGAELDFGDAPDPFTGIGRYATLFDNDGARHVITETPIFLGSGVDADADGQPSLTADGDDADHVLDISASNLSVTGTAPYSIVVPAAGGAAINDGEMFTIERFNGQTVTFEFDENGVSADTKKINFTAATTRDELANAIVAAIQADTPQNNSNHDLLVLHPANLGNGIVFIGGKLRHTVDASQSSIVVEGSPASVLRIPATAMGTANIGDGDLIVFHDGAGSVTFEFDSDATVAMGNTAVTFVDTETPSEFAMNLISAVQSSGLQFAAPNGSMTHQGSGVIQVAGPASHSLDISQSPSLAPAGRIPLLVDTPATGLAIKVPAILQLEVSVGSAPTDIQDGDMFIINDRINPTVTFEFEIFGGVAAGSHPISFADTQTPEVVADRMVAVIQQAADDGLLVGIQPVRVSGGLIDLQPVAIVSVDSTQSHLAQTGPVVEGQTFSIDLDGPSGISPSVIFEFTKTGNVSGTNRSVQIQDVQSADDVAKSIVTAIKNAALSGDLAGVVTNNLGDGLVDVSGPTDLVVDLTNSTDLTQDGVAGGLADGQSFIIDDGVRQVTFEFDRNDRTTTGNVVVSTVTKVGTQLPSEWVERTVDEIGAEIAQAIMATGLAVFAADLGGGSVQFQRDDEDGVRFDSIFTPNAATPITVTASADGTLNAWFDWNQDGDWNDPNEQVFTDQAVQAGANSLSIMVPDFAPAPSTLPLGLTAARFRFSSESGLLPTGLAVDGEVEDYRIRVISNNAPTVVQPGLPNVPADVAFPVLEDDADHTFDASAFFSDIDITNGNGDFLIFTVVGNTNPSLVDARVGLDGRTVVLDFLDDQNGVATVRMRATDQGG
ncbi:MAG: GEVED domain-containing protein, partial [Pirellulaceae bacterium]|nr:GEVED domain-containing protein [Pirellulaceae bacterium]